MKKVAFIDLTKINNPKPLAKRGPNEASFALPHLSPFASVWVTRRGK